MRLLGIDIEGAYGVMNPHEEGFYTSCVGLVEMDYETEEVLNETVVWLDHEECLPTPGATDIIQMVVDKCDLVIGHNLKYDIKALMSYGVDFSKATIWDNMVVEYTLCGQDVGNRRFRLKDLAEWYKLDPKDGDEVRALWDAGVDTKDIPIDILERYQVRDCYLPIELYRIQVRAAASEGILKVVQLQNEWTLCLIEMEYNGIRFDKELALKIRQENIDKAIKIEEYFKLMSGIPELKITSPKQKSALIFGGKATIEREVWVQRTLKSKPETTYNCRIKRMEVEFPGLGFAWPTNPRQLRGVKNNKKYKRDEIKKAIVEDGCYFAADKDTIFDLPSTTAKLREHKEKLLELSACQQNVKTLMGLKGKTGLIPKQDSEGFIHPNFNQTVSRTGRLTSSNPNGQNLNKIIKQCFKPRGGKFTNLAQHDLSQIEWRMAAEMSQDPTMLYEINHGVDQHAATVTELMEMYFKEKGDPESDKNRTIAKVFNFRMIFLGTEWGFHLDVKMPDFGIAKWKQTIKNFWKKYKMLWKKHQSNIKQVREEGKLVGITGRKFVFYEDFLTKSGDLDISINQVANYPIQGPSYDILALMGVIIRRGMKANKMKSKMVLTVHDSLVFDVYEGEEEMLKKLCYGVSNSLREYIKSYFGINWKSYLEGEFEIGKDYKNLNFVHPNSTVEEVI